MKHISKLSATTRWAAVSASLVLLAGCDLGNKNEQEANHASEMVSGAACTIVDDPLVLQGEVLVSMDGKPIVSVKSFERHFNKLLEDNPQYKEFLARSPEAKRNALQGLAGQAAIDEEICRKGIDQTPAYREELKWRLQAEKRMLNLKYFTEAMDVKVTDAEIKDAYEKNKDTMPQLLISRGGVKAMGIAFDKEKDAQDFAQAVGKQNMDAYAKAQNMADRVRDFKSVHAGSFGIDPVVRDAVIAMKAFPSTKVVKGKDDKFWVVQATAMEEKQYRPFAEVKDSLRAFVEREKGIKLFEQELDRLKNEYKIVVNESYFGPTSAPDQEALMQELEQMINEEGQAGPMPA